MKKYQSTIEVFGVIPCPWFAYIDKNKAQQEHEFVSSTVSEFISLGDIAQLNLWDGQKYLIGFEEFHSLNKYRHFKKTLSEHGHRHLVRNIYLRLSVEILYSDKEIEVLTKGVTDSIANEYDLKFEELISLYLGSVIEELHLLLLDFYLALSIAKPGIFNIWDSWMFIDGKFKGKANGAATSFDFVKDRAIRNEWPKIKSLKIKDTYKWLHNSPGFSNRQGIGPIGRALAALSYLIKIRTKNNNELALIWALLGLEALYCRENTNLKSQLLKKSEALLGPRTKNKKVFGWMYDFRSRLLHGDLDFLYQHNEYDATTEYKKLWEEFDQCEELATSMLIATLQTLCINNTYTLEFDYIVRKNNNT